MAQFVQIGDRVVNLDLVCGAERPRHRGPVTLHFAAPTGSGGGVGGPGGGLTWVFSDPHEADVLWLKLVPHRGDLTDLAGGPYSITDNETTASREDPD
jgi:hypothetical protein